MHGVAGRDRAGQGRRAVGADAGDPPAPAGRVQPDPAGRGLLPERRAGAHRAHHGGPSAGGVRVQPGALRHRAGGVRGSRARHRGRQQDALRVVEDGLVPCRNHISGSARVDALSCY